MVTDITTHKLAAIDKLNAKMWTNWKNIWILELARWWVNVNRNFSLPTCPPNGDDVLSLLDWRLYKFNFNEVISTGEPALSPIFLLMRYFKNKSAIQLLWKTWVTVGWKLWFLRNEFGYTRETKSGGYHPWGLGGRNLYPLLAFMVVCAGWSSWGRTKPESATVNKLENSKKNKQN